MPIFLKYEKFNIPSVVTILLNTKSPLPETEKWFENLIFNPSINSCVFHKDYFQIPK